MKRHQQIISKKNSIAGNVKSRSVKTGQVIGDSKGAKTSDMDNYALQTIGMNHMLKELMGARADDLKAKSQLYEKINNEGFAYQKEIESSPKEKVTLGTVDAIFLSAGIHTNLINSSLALKQSTKK